MRWRSTSAAATRARRSRRSARSRSRPRRPSWRRTTSSPCSATCSPPAARIACRTAPLRDEELRQALDLPQRSPAARSAEEGARLLAAEWALDDRDAPRAIELLDALPLGVARRTHALRLKLQAARLGRQPQEALKTARLLVKHQGFSDVAAAGLLRSLAFESLDTVARRRPAAPALARRSTPPIVAIRSSRRARRPRAMRARRADDARAWLRPFWDRVAELGADERAAVAEALAPARAAASAPNGCRGSSRRCRRCRATARSRWRPAARSPSAGCGARRRRLLEQAADDDSARRVVRRRKAWIALAELAAQEGDTARAATAASRPPRAWRAGASAAIIAGSRGCSSVG